MLVLLYNQCKQRGDVAGEIRCFVLHETSDLRLKTDIKTINNALDKVSQLRGVSFHWNEEAESSGAPNKDKQLGVVAQEVERIFPELVTTPENGYKSVDYTKLTSVLIEAIKELNIDNNELRVANATLQKDLSTMKNDIETLKTLIK